VDGVRAATAVGADAAAAVVSQQLEASGWPSILTRAISGRLLLKLHAGPPNSQSVAGIEVGTQGQQCYCSWLCACVGCA
jgi:hypothetical protein